MYAFVALTYGVLASFIMSSADRNKRQARRNPPILTHFAWGLLSFSAAAATILVSYVSWQALTGGAVAPVA